MATYEDKKIYPVIGRKDLGLFPKREDLLPDSPLLDIADKIAEIKREADIIRLNQMVFTLGRSIGSMNDVNRLNLINGFGGSTRLRSLLSQRKENVIPPAGASSVDIACVQDKGATCRFVDAGILDISFYEGGGTDLDAPCKNGHCPAFSGITDRYYLISPLPTIPNAGYEETERFPLPDLLYQEPGPIEADVTETDIRNYAFLFSNVENKMYNGLAARGEFEDPERANDYEDILDFSIEHDNSSTIEGTNIGTVFSGDCSIQADGVTLNLDDGIPLITKSPIYAFVWGNSDIRSISTFTYPTISISSTAGMVAYDVFSLDKSGMYYIISVDSGTDLTIQRIEAAVNESLATSLFFKYAEFRDVVSAGIPVSSILPLDKQGILDHTDFNISDVKITESIPIGTLSANITDTEDINISIDGLTENISVNGTITIGSEEISFGAIADGNLIGIDRGAYNTTAASHTIGDDVYFSFHEDLDFNVSDNQKKIFITNGSLLDQRPPTLLFQVEITSHQNKIVLEASVKDKHNRVALVCPSFKIVVPNISVTDLMAALYFDFFDHVCSGVHVSRQEVCDIMSGESEICCTNVKDIIVSANVLGNNVNLFIDMDSLGELAAKTITIDWGDGVVYYSGVLDMSPSSEILYNEQSTMKIEDIKGLPSDGRLSIGKEIIAYDVWVQETPSLVSAEGLLRGANGTIPQPHDNGTDVKYATVDTTHTVDKTYGSTGNHTIRVTVKSLSTNCNLEQEVDVVI